MKRSGSYFLLLCALPLLVAGPAHGQGCTAARGCPTIPPQIPSAGAPSSVQAMMGQGAGEGAARQDGTSAGQAWQQPGSFGAEQAAFEAGGFLKPGKVIFTYQWNYSDADKIYFKTEQLPDMDMAVQLISIQNEHVVAAEIGIAERFSFIYELPFQYNRRSLNTGIISGGRLRGRLLQQTAGLADSRAYFRYWLSPCLDCNVAVYGGVKVPTGDQNSGAFYQDEFLYDDISIQTGTGSWDPLFGFHAFKRWGKALFFGGFNYRLTPAVNTSALALDPQLMNPDSTVLNAIADQWSADLGVNLSLGQWLNEEGYCCSDCIKGLNAAFSVVTAAIPKHDLIGDDGDYRRAFTAVYLRPGINWNVKDGVTFFANTPITVYRDLITAPGSFANLQLSMGLFYNW